MAPKAPQKTRLDDNAEIYKRREQKSERQKLSELNFSGKVEYFKNYYLKKLLAFLIIGGMLTWILVTMLSPKPETVLSVALINFPLDQTDIEQMTTDLSDILNVDSETQEIVFDTGYDLNNYDYASAEKLTTYTYAGEIDIFIAPESQFLKYAFSNTMASLTDILPTDVYSTLDTDDLFICKTRQDDEELPSEAKGPEGVYGIYIDDLSMFDFFTPDSIVSDPPVIGVVISGKNQENAVEFIKYLLKQKN